MIELGIVMKINAGLGNTIGGFLDTLPKDQALPGWTYGVVSRVRKTTLQCPSGLSMMRLQVDIYGYEAQQGADVLTIAKQIDLILNGYRGALPDPDSTYVDSCFTSDVKDFPLDPESRNYRRMLEYEIWYAG